MREGKSRGAATGFSGLLPFYMRSRWLMLSGPNHSSCARSPGGLLPN